MAWLRFVVTVALVYATWWGATKDAKGEWVNQWTVSGLTWHMAAPPDYEEPIENIIGCLIKI